MADFVRSKKEIKGSDMFDNDETWCQSLLGTLFLSGMFYLADRRGRNSAIQEMENSKRDQEMEELKRQINELKQKQS